MITPKYHITPQSQPRSFHNSAAARAAGYWDDPNDPRTQWNVARLFENAHFVPVNSLSDRYLSEYGRALGRWPELPERGILHPWIAAALLSSTSPLTLFNLDTRALSSTPTTYLTLTLRIRRNPDAASEMPSFHTLKSRLRGLCSQRLGDAIALQRMYEQVYGFPLQFPMPILADDKVSTWGWIASWEGLVGIVMEVNVDSGHRRGRRKGEKGRIESREVEEEEKEDTWSEEEEKDEIWSEDEEKEERCGEDKVMVEIEDGRKRENENDEALSEELVMGKNIATRMTINRGITLPSSPSTPPQRSSPQQSQRPQAGYTSNGQLFSHCANNIEFTFSTLTPPVTRAPKTFFPRPPGLSPLQGRLLPLSPNQRCGDGPRNDLALPATSENEDDMNWDKDKGAKKSSESRRTVDSHTCASDDTSILYNQVAEHVLGEKVGSIIKPHLRFWQDMGPRSFISEDAAASELGVGSWAWRATHAPRDELESVAARVRVMRCFEDTQYVAVEWLAEHYWRKYHRVLYHEHYVGDKLATVLPGIVARGFLPRLHLVKVFFRGYYGCNYRYFTALPSQIQRNSGMKRPPPPRDGRELRHRVLRLASPHPYPRHVLRKIVEKLYLRTYGHQPFDDGRWVKGEDGTVFRSWDMWWKGKWGRELGELGVRVEGVKVEWEHEREDSRNERELISRMRMRKREVEAELGSKRKEMERMSDKRVRRFLEMELKDADKMRKKKKEESNDVTKAEEMHEKRQKGWQQLERVDKLEKDYDDNGLLMDDADEEEEIGDEDEADDETNSISSDTNEHVPRVEWNLDDTPLILLEDDSAAPLRECDQLISEARPIGAPVIALCADNGMCKVDKDGISKVDKDGMSKVNKDGISKVNKDDISKVDKGSNSNSRSGGGAADGKVGPTLRLNLDPVLAAYATDGKAGPALRLNPDPARFGMDASSRGKIAWSSSIIYPNTPPRPNFSNGSSRLTEPAPARPYSLASRPVTTVSRFDLNALSHATLPPSSRSVPAAPSSNRPPGLPLVGLGGRAIDKAWRVRR